jgi:hypothetical protein
MQYYYFKIYLASIYKKIFSMAGSRLLTSGKKIRDFLVTRNLYTPYVAYPQPLNNVEKTVTAIDTILSGVLPFKSISLPNSVLVRIANIGDETPLSKIGLTMLAKQMTLNEMSHVAQRALPVVNVSNMFDGNPNTNLFTKNEDMRVTVNNEKSDIGRFIDKIYFGCPNTESPFNKNSTNDEYLKNSGAGQLRFMYGAVGLNKYRPTEKDNSYFYERAGSLNINKVNLNVLENKNYFNLINNKFNPYNVNSYNENLILIANHFMNNSVYDRGIIEYGSDIDFIEKLGITAYDVSNSSAWDSNDANSWLEYSITSKNSSRKNIIWGKDGVSKEYLELSGIKNKIGTFNEDNVNIIADDYSNFESSFNIKNGGLLEYTRNLVTATSGRIGDLTRKAFTKGNGDLTGFNGSGVWKSNNSDYANKSGFNDHTGVRQHSAIDQYDRFTKAIRFNGNEVYGGSSDSVIYDTVMPRITPKFNNEGNIDTKKLMLSIENLAVHVIKSENYNGGGTVGIMDDEVGSAIPACEIGPFNGRIMWFPPYALDIQETSSAKFESTVMVGRNEPMYNYMNSERSATLNFKLLIDYPPQLLNYRGRNDIHQKVSEFFAFGGNDIENIGYTDNVDKKINDLQKKKADIESKRVILMPEYNQPDEITIYYPNDYPKPYDSNSTTIVDEMYKNRYEIGKNVVASTYNGSEGSLNNSIYYISGLTETTVSGKTMYTINGTPTFSQYSATGVTNPDNSVSVLNKTLYDAFIQEDFAKYYDIKITGAASKLWKADYNKELGFRRARAFRNLIQSKLDVMFGKNKIKPNFKLYSSGEEEASGSNVDEIARDAINRDDVKDDRYASAVFVSNGKTIEPIIVKDNTKQEKDAIDVLNKEIDALEKIKSSENAGLNPFSDCVMNELDNSKDEGKVLSQFESFKDGYYQPIFHSQTPEDFHKRLTFLQQCTRQGSAKSYYYNKDGASEDDRVMNSVFGRQPICILRVGDFFYTKVIIESVNVDYSDTTWDMNPEGFGMQPMIASITLNMKVIGGQSLKGPIDALQNAVSYNYYANSSFTNKGRYKLPSDIAVAQEKYKKGVLEDINAKYKAALTSNESNNNTT